MKSAWLALLLGLFAPGAALAGEQAARVFSEVSPSVYSVIAEGGKSAGMLGSGVVIAPGRVVTNFHVINGAERIRVRHGGEEIEAALESSDPAHDLALLRVSGLRAAPVSLGETGGIRIGQTVYAIGSPRGLELSLSEGLISSLRETPDGNAIQTTAPISPGSSGGGLFDERGRLLGFTTAQVINGQNLNFAVPVEWLRYVGVTLPAHATAARETASSDLPLESLEPAVAPVLATALETQQAPPQAAARNATKSPAKTPNLYIATAMIALLLIGAKPAINWLSDYLARDPIAVPVARAPSRDRLAPFRMQPREEIQSGRRNAEVWRLALEQSAGDERRAVMTYIELRAQALHKSEMDRRWEEAKNGNQHPGSIQRQPEGK